MSKAPIMKLRKQSVLRFLLKKMMQMMKAVRTYQLLVKYQVVNPLEKIVQMKSMKTKIRQSMKTLMVKLRVKERLKDSMMQTLLVGKVRCHICLSSFC